jgi:hypothetical protein
MVRDVGSCRSSRMGVVTGREMMFGAHALYHHRTAPCVHSADFSLLPAPFVIHNRPSMRLSRPSRPVRPRF